MGNLTRQDYIVKLLMQKKKMSVEELASQSRPQPFGATF